MSWACSLCRDFGTLNQRNKNRLCDYMTTEPARLAGITVLWCWESRLLGSPANQNQARNGTGCNTLLTTHIKIAASKGSPGSCNTRIKVISVEPASPAHIIRSFLPVSGIVTQFAPENFGIHRFSCSCVREYDLI